MILTSSELIANKTRIRYIRDPENAERVMTLVTRLSDAATIEYAYSLNSPPSIVKHSESDDLVVYRKEKGDKFSRDKGRKIAFGRLANERTRSVVVLAEGSFPFREVLKSLCHSNVSSPTVVRIARSMLKDSV